MKKMFPLIASAMILSISPAFALDGVTPSTDAADAKSNVAQETTTETRTDALQTQTTPGSETVKKEETTTQESTSQASPVMESQPSTTTQTSADTTDKNAVTGVSQTSTETQTKTTAPNVQKLFGLFHPDKEAEATPGNTPAAGQGQEAAPGGATTPGTQTPQ